MKRKIGYCEECGEYIPKAVPREDGRIVCERCVDEPEEHSRKTDEASKHDAAYHGDRFHAGEW